MPDKDPISNLRNRVAECEAKLIRIRTGNEPAPPFDPMAWTVEADTPAPEERRPTRSARLLEAIRRNLREDWNGLDEAVANWLARIDKRFAKQ